MKPKQFKPMICFATTVLTTYTLGGNAVFLYSKYSEYIHVIKTGITPSKKDTWKQNKQRSIRKLARSSQILA